MRFITVIQLMLLLNFMFGCSAINDPENILSQYNIGSKLQSIKIDKNDIIFEINNDKGWDSDINVLLKGYSKPKKFIKNNQKLIIVDKGEYAVYLYFDIDEKLIDKEIVGT